MGLDLKQNFPNKFVSRVDRAGRLSKLSPIFRALLSWVDSISRIFGTSKKPTDKEALNISEKTLSEIKDFYEFQLNQTKRVQDEKKKFTWDILLEFDENEKQITFLLGHFTEFEKIEQKILE